MPPRWTSLHALSESGVLQSRCETDRLVAFGCSARAREGNHFLPFPLPRGRPADFRRTRCRSAQFALPLAAASHAKTRRFQCGGSVPRLPRSSDANAGSAASHCWHGTLRLIVGLVVALHVWFCGSESVRQRGAFHCRHWLVLPTVGTGWCFCDFCCALSSHDGGVWTCCW